ncbi:hypothetical protein LO762_19685 [Actinocorallia sp. API 0066]|uniref:alpha/beta hydrolase family esterase n=1 Tax=Actinocorallia sp. API 0066 TaxID=2896846 RepID=UPI001E4D4392|nr:PHB depolymerase family esterase [Actinocorallia sp. API 0066]MCD0451404.1 hypothetical protein [Actinocorallia sp. API 0066]
MRRLLVLVLLLAAVGACTADGGDGPAPPSGTPTARAGIPVTPGTHRLTIDVDGPGMREYLLRVPKGFKEPAPLVLAVHGGASNAERFVGQSGWNEVADREKILVAYPDGFLLSWNAGGCCGPAKAAKTDDAGFLRQLVDTLVDAGVADRQRVFVAGFSNGGGMAYRLACEGPGRVKGIGVVSASLIIDCEPDRPVSAMIVHGRADTSVPFAGGGRRDFNDPRPFTPVSEAVSFFRREAGIPELVRDGVCRQGENDGTVVRFCPHGGGHVWPDGMAARLWGFFAAL